ncbi:MAG: acyltransferase [Firmicutes bacterium]|nr:acyltransferase [Bacillota bacterium]
MRRLTEYPALPGENSLWRWTRRVNPLKVVRNFLVIWFCRYCPSLRLKNWLYRRIGMKVGRGVAVGLGAVFDVFYPELITLEDRVIVGYNAVILCHEFLADRLRIGPVRVGAGAMIGANATILAGIEIGAGAVVGAMSLVSRDIPEGAVVGGVPARRIEGSSLREKEG